MAGLIYNIIAAKKILPQNSIIRCLYVCSAVMFISVVLAAVYSDYFTSVYILYLMWLMVMASVDYYTGYVYVKMEYAVIVPVILCIISLFNTSYNKEHIEALAISVCIISALLKISSKAGWFGEGDSDVLICSSVFLSAGTALHNGEISDVTYIVMDNIITNMFYISFSGFLFFIRYIGTIKLKKLSLKERKPFIPSIYMAGVIFFTVIQIKK